MHAPSHARPEPAPGNAASSVTQEPGHRGRVLLVEDQEAMRTFLAELLSQEGYEVLIAANGIEAIAILEREYQVAPLRPHPPFGVVVTDHRMPGATGLEIQEYLRRHRWRPAVILISAFADPELRTEAIRLGVASVMDKPFSIHDLLETIAGLQSAG